MATVKLNETFIESYPTPEKQTDINDTIITGLCVRINPTGYKSYGFRFKYAGKFKRLSIGKTTHISLEQAREICRHYHYLLQQGKNPIAEKKKREHTIITFEQLVKKYRENRLCIKSENTQKNYNVYINKNLNVLNDKYLEDISRNDILNILEKNQLHIKHPTTANLIKATLSAVLQYGVERGLIEKNTCHNIKAFPMPVKKKKRAYSIDELKVIWNTVHSFPTPYKQLFQILIITGKRKHSVLKSKWEYIDFKEKKWITPAELSKTNNEHVLPLTDKLISIFKELQEYSSDSKYVFKSNYYKDKDTPITNPTSYIKKLKQRIPDFQIHCLRHTVRTRLSMLVVSNNISGKSSIIEPC
jgi:integrase